MMVDNTRRALLVFYALTLLPTAVPAPAATTLRGPVESVETGDTLVIAGQRVRLWGIDAPDLDQPCMDGDRLPYRCGVTARMVLEALTRTREVVCGIAENGTDTPPLAVCRAGDSDLGALMVATGYAFDRPEVSGGLYADEEAQAKARQSGLWAGAFVKPLDWRRERVGSR